ncbi:MAG: hypothetical protein WC974_03520 [Thermoplasmata archaeon]
MPIIRGFTDEKTHLRQTFNELKPDAVAISISAGEYAGIKDADENKEFDNEPSSYDEIYMNGLRNFGEVKAPPPCWFEINRLCKEDNIPIRPIDMSEEEFTDAYCNLVSTIDLLKYSFKIKRLRKTKLKAKSAEEFVTKLDNITNSIKGFHKLETKREVHIVKKLQELGDEYGNILAIVEYERARGVYEKFKNNQK